MSFTFETRGRKEEEEEEKINVKILRGTHTHKLEKRSPLHSISLSLIHTIDNHTHLPRLMCVRVSVLQVFNQSAMPKLPGYLYGFTLNIGLLKEKEKASESECMHNLNWPSSSLPSLNAGRERERGGEREKVKTSVTLNAHIVF